MCHCFGHVHDTVMLTFVQIVDDQQNSELAVVHPRHTVDDLSDKLKLLAQKHRHASIMYSDGSSKRHTRHWPWAPGIWGPPTLKICVIMSKCSLHSCDAKLQYGKFSLAPTALAKQQLILVKARNKITHFVNSQIAVKEKFCFDVDVGCPFMGPQNI